MSKSITEYTQVLNSFLGLRQTFGKPQKLTIIGNNLYWLEGSSQELFSSDLQSLVVTKVISPPAPSGKMSKEEELLRERQRTLATGISSFRVRESDGAVFFQSGIELSIYYPATGVTLRPFDAVSGDALSASPKMCIQHVDEFPLTEIAFVQDGNLFRATIVETSAEGILTVGTHVRRITSVGKEQFECGTADYIMQEEFSRYTGHWSHKQRTLFTQTDTTMLKQVTLIGANDTVERMPFPRVGDPNAVTTIAVHDGSDDTFRVLPLCEIRAVAPWAEYFPRFGFIDHDNFFVTVLDRRQEQSAIISIHIPSLPLVAEQEIIHTSQIHTAPAFCPPGSVALIWEQNIPWAWIDVTDSISLRLSGPELIGAHDHTSHYFHLYQRDRHGTPSTWNAVTQGNFNVAPRFAVVDQDNVAFIANKLDHFGTELYLLTLSSKTMKRLSPVGTHVHSYTVSRTPDGKIAVGIVASTLHEPPKLSVGFLLEANSDEEVILRPLDTAWSFAKLTGAGAEKITAPVVHHMTNSRGAPISAAVFLPAHVDPGKKIPLLVYCYGGPHVQLIHSNNYDLRTNVVAQALCSLGVAVAICDNQMSQANSLKHHSICKRNMGHFETADNVDLVRGLANIYSCLDLGRVGIFGWSYGGYATLLALSQAPDVFKLGFSGAPVGDWRLYDTGYTERYMGLLEEAKDTYESSTIAAGAKGFPDEIGRVFIAHGLLDENVHFSHTCAIIDAMVECGKPYSLLVYPGERHGLRQKPKSRAHYDSQLLKTVVELL